MSKDIVCATCGKVQTYIKPPRVAGRPPVRCRACHKPTNKVKDATAGFGSWQPEGEPR